MLLRQAAIALISSSVLFAQEPPQQQSTEPAVEKTGWKKVEGDPAKGEYRVDPGTRVPLNLINSIGTKGSSEGDRVYLETAFPILAGGRIVIPPGSYVAGTVTQVKRAGRVKGKAELFIRFDSLTLPNGTTRDFRARMSGMDGTSGQKLDRSEGKVIGEGNKGGDARTVGETAVSGTWIGTVAGAAAGRPGMGAGVGAAAGAAAGMVGVLLTRGPDAVLPKGTTVEMVLDRPLVYLENELDFQTPPRRSLIVTPAAATTQDQNSSPIPGMGRRRVP